MNPLRPLPTPRHYLSVPRPFFDTFATLPPAARDQVMAQALATVRGRIRVLVCDANRVLLTPCHPARARELIRRGRGQWLSLQPPLLQLHRAVGPVQPAQVRP